jgi:uncharacterized membrane protein (DUF4010 family)
MDTHHLVEAMYAIGIGLVVGLEREHSVVVHDEPPAPADLVPSGAPPPSASPASAELPPPATGAPPALVPGGGAPALVARAPDPQAAMGARTMALLALVGWLLAYLGDRDPWLLPIGLVGVVVLIGAQMYIGREVGMTTEAAGVVVVLLGALVHLDRPLAVALCLGTTLLLVSKPWMRRFVTHLRRIEITATLQLLLLVAIVLPLLPTRAVDPWEALPPRKVGTFIVLIAGVQYIGYVLTRLLGPTRGVGLAGLVGGLTSSTAVTVSMARAASASPEATGPSLLATFLANMVMPVRVAIIAGAISPPVGWRIAAAMSVMAIVLLVAAAVTGVRLRRGPSLPASAVKLKNPFELWGALTWGVVLCGVLLGAKLATRWMGDEGLLVAAGLSGLTDVDAITLAAAAQARDSLLTAELAALAITIAVAVNTIVKAGMAWFGGGRRFGRPVAAVFALAIALALATALVVAAT